MTRSIAILTLALTAALSADQAFALDPGDCSSALRTGVHVDGVVYELSLWDADDLELLVAFVAYEYGTEAACELLLALDGDQMSGMLNVMIVDSGGGSD